MGAKMRTRETLVGMPGWRSLLLQKIERTWENKSGNVGPKSVSPGVHIVSLDLILVQVVILAYKQSVSNHPRVQINGLELIFPVQVIGLELFPVPAPSNGDSIGHHHLASYHGNAFFRI